MAKQPITVYVLVLSLAAASSGSTCRKVSLLLSSTLTLGPACARVHRHLHCWLQVRFATYNTSLNRDKAGQLLAELQSGKSAQAANVSAILQTIRPDVLVLNEFDYEPGNVAVQAFQDNFLDVSQAPGLEPLRQGLFHCDSCWGQGDHLVDFQSRCMTDSRVIAAVTYCVLP